MYVFGVLCFSVYIYLINCEIETYRLSSTEAQPIHYSIKIKPDFDNYIFHGEVSIFVSTHSDLEGIILHSANLTISEVKLNQNIASFETKTNEKIRIFYQNTTIQPGEQLVDIKYTGLIAKNNGFIRATFGNEENKVYIFVTDLEPTYARTVFPCFDEPLFKANFNLRLISPNATYTAISNMPEINRFTTPDGSVVYDFTASLKMSPYLLSFAFTDNNYSYYENFFVNNGKKIPIRIYTVNASKENNEFAFNCAKTALEFYSEYTNISYPMPKLDMIEYRRNMTAATENWGLITFREGLLTPSLKIYNKYQIKLVAFHELGHFWFGNLVTNQWWDDLWLQEGFATYMSYKLLAKDGGRKNVVDEMRTFSFNDYFDIEIYGNKPAIVSYIIKQADIEGVFNDLVYYKSAAVLLMLEELIGEDTFQQIVRIFLKKYAYSTATTNDFIAAVEEVVTDKPLRSFMESYLFQKKIPVISVDVLDNSTYILTQEPTVIINRLEQIDNKREKWTIPVTYQTDSTNISTFWFDKDEDSVTLNLPDAKWLLFNPNGMGIYRTAFSSKLWEQLINNFREMPVSTTESILLDVFYSFSSNKITCDIFIRLMDQVTKEQRGKWTYFHSMLEHVKDNLICHNHKYEADIFWKYFQMRLEETENLRHPTFTEAECNTKYIQKGEKFKKNVCQCAEWIRDNLKGKDSNIIKPA